MNAKHLMLVTCASVLIAACNTGIPGKPTQDSGAGKMCTMDAKQCPDGSFVGRDAANNCAFKPCPGAK